MRTIYVPERLHSLLVGILHPDRGLGHNRVSLWYEIKKILTRNEIVVPGPAGNTSFPHALRATCATLLASKGASSAAICYHMGWSDLKVAERYIQMAAAKEQAQEEVERIFGS